MQRDHRAAGRRLGLWQELGPAAQAGGPLRRCPPCRPLQQPCLSAVGINARHYIPPFRTPTDFALAALAGGLAAAVVASLEAMKRPSRFCGCSCITSLKIIAFVTCAIYSTGFALAALAWGLMAAVFALEAAGRHSLQRTWMRRFPLVLIFAAELAKFRRVLVCQHPPRASASRSFLPCACWSCTRLGHMAVSSGCTWRSTKRKLSDSTTAPTMPRPPPGRLILHHAWAHGYFFWLYVVYCGCITALAALALAHWPARESLQLWSERDDDYLVGRPHQFHCPIVRTGVSSLFPNCV